jgi:hypothetical protein
LFAQQPQRTLRDMSRRPPRLLILVLLLAAACTRTTPAAGPEQEATPASGTRSSLFVLTADRGELEGAAQLRIWPVDSQVLSFTDRPERRAAAIPVPAFMRMWDDLGFGQDPPNASVTVRGKDGAVSVPVEILDIEYAATDGSLTIGFRPLGEVPAGLRSVGARTGTAEFPQRFTAPALFIDNANESCGTITDSTRDTWYFVVATAGPPCSEAMPVAREWVADQIGFFAPPHQKQATIDGFTCLAQNQDWTSDDVTCRGTDGSFFLTGFTYANPPPVN